MLFPTTDFAIFFTGVFVIGWLLSRHVTSWQIAMVCASYIFYGWWDWRFDFLLLLVTFVSVITGSAIGREENKKKRKLIMSSGVTVILSILAWFKYYGFFISNVDNTIAKLGFGHSLFPLLSITLPVGISFFTFMAISYVVDIYRGSILPAKPLEVATYLSFFPHLVAGPIVRGTELLPQIREKKIAGSIKIGESLWLILAGLFKKVVISSFVSTAIVNPVFQSPNSHSSIDVLFAVYGYAVQIWADFSGYTDIAIGVAQLIGIKFPQNFDSPYAAENLQDFWKRWHITLSRWLRDYLYIPLGGNRGSTWITSRNILITMILGGLWHGASWTFLCWGAIHGVGQVIGHIRRKYRVTSSPTVSKWRTIVARISTFHIVCFGWIFFRADTIGDAFSLIKSIFTRFEMPTILNLNIALVIIASIAIQQLPRGWAQRFIATFARQKLIVQGLISGASLVLITTLGPQGVAPFIYYRF